MTQATDNQDLNRQLRQLEAIAALSGGIAHDYNNLLTAIMGNISLALDHVHSDDRIFTLLEQALAASRAARTLTQTLITFSKGGVPAKKPTDIVQVVENTAAFSLSGSNISCDFKSSQDTWLATCDSQQMGQAIHNLMINAAESMPWGGTVSIRFENTIRDGGDGLLEPGRYIDISITDQGVGIPAENMDKIFAPYFSTKTMGSDKGTGLGLSISHSIVRKHGGEITVSSRPGVGSTFHVMLPASEASTAADQPSCQIPRTKRPQKPIVGKGKILVMDDEAMIRQLAGNMLKHLGYDVDFAREGVETVRKYQAAMDTSAPFDAVILDLTIKGGMGGRETMQQLKAIDPAVKAVVSSGYSDDPVIANYEQYGFCEAVGKPYEMVEFSQTLHRVTNDH